MKKYLLSLTLLFICLVAVFSQDHFFRQYTKEDGLNDAFINAIGQDNDGFLWIGTAEGLNKFDGFNFTHYTSEDGMADSYISEIYLDSSGRLWLGHRNGEVTILVNDKFIIPEIESDSKGTVEKIIEDDSGLIWIISQNRGLYRADINNNIVSIGHLFEFESFTSFMPIGDNYYFLGSDEGLGLYTYNETAASLEEEYIIDEFPYSGVADISRISQNSFLIISRDDGIFDLTLENDYSDYILSPVEDSTKGMLDNLQDVLIDNSNSVWVASMGNGIVKYKKESTGNLEYSGMISDLNGLVSNNVNCIYEDLEGNIWLGMFGEGLLKYIDDNLKFYTYENSIGSNNCFSIASSDNDIWVISEKNLININQNDGQIKSLIKLPGYLNESKINSLYYAYNGLIYLGTEKYGLIIFNPLDLTFKKMRLSDDDLENSINYITGDSKYLWIATKKGVLKLNPSTGEKIRFTTREGGLPHNNIQTIFIDSRNRVLIGTMCNFIFYIDDENKVNHDPELKLVGLKSVISIIEGPDQEIWVATAGSGVIRFRKDTDWNYTRSSTTGLLSDYCYSMAYNYNGKVLVGHRGGFSQIDTETNRVKTYSRYEGIKSSAELYTNAIVKDDYNSIWFGTSEGIIKFLPDLTRKGLTPPLIHIDAIRINGIDYAKADVINLKPGFYDLELDYMAINFSNPELVNYQTWLEGYDSNWSNFTTRRQITYFRVGHGSYLFKIRAFNEYDVPSEKPVQFEIRIKRPIYLSLWFYFSLFIIISVSIYILIKTREKNLRNAQANLIKNLDEATKEVIIKEEIIKERKKNEKVLIEAKERAELSDRLKSSFLTNMSHEIRTPMNAIVGLSELLKDPDYGENEKHEFADTIVQNSRQLITLIDDIIDISKIESNQLKLKFKDCNIETLLDELQASYRKILDDADKSKIELILKKDSKYTAASIETDCSRLRQVLCKLLDNAIKFTDAGSISFGYDLIDGKIRFFVEDTGIGMAPEKKQVIFELFRKVEDNNLRLYRGTGLGLSLSQHLVLLMGGEIEVESEENKGSRFIFSLPVTKDQITLHQGSEPFTEPVQTFDFSNRNILIVEDDASNFLLVNEILKQTKATIIKADNGHQALKIFTSSEPIDLILMDIKLPGLDGYEITRQIREMDKDIPIIAHTAYAMEGDREQSIESGCNEYISKPTDKKLLLSTIKKLLGEIKTKPL